MARKSRKNITVTQTKPENMPIYIKTAQYIRLSVEDSHNKGKSIENQKMILDERKYAFGRSIYRQRSDRHKLSPPRISAYD